MMTRLLSGAAVLAIATLSIGGSGAYAQNTMLTALTTAEVGAALTNAGYTFSVSASSNGNPMLEVDASALPAEQFIVFFYDCNDKGSCEDIELWSWYSVSNSARGDLVNAWNAGNRWTSSFLDGDKDPNLVMNINATGGIGTDAVYVLVNTYRTAIIDFAAHLGL